MEIVLIVKAIIMGIIQGVTEFLPISSTGHLILFGQILNFSGDNKAFADSFNIIIQLGSILAVVLFYRTKIFTSFKNLGRNSWGRTLWINVIIACLPAVVIGFLFRSQIKEVLYNVPVVSVALIVGGILLYLGDTFKPKKERKTEMELITPSDSLKVGLFQCLSLIPGMSRSGSTITGGLFFGLERKVAAEFSFFLAIPLMFGATLLELKDINVTSSGEWAALAVGFVVSFIVAYFVVGFFLKFLAKHSLRGFAYYRIVVGVVLLVLMFTGVLNVKI